MKFILLELRNKEINIKLIIAVIYASYCSRKKKAWKISSLLVFEAWPPFLFIPPVDRPCLNEFDFRNLQPRFCSKILLDSVKRVKICFRSVRTGVKQYLIFKKKIKVVCMKGMSFFFMQQAMRWTSAEASRDLRHSERLLNKSH